MRTHRIRPRMALLVLLSGFLFAPFDGIGQTTTQGGSDINIDVDDPRPLMAAVEALERRFGWVVTYEDPPFVSPDDFADVTDLTRRTPWERGQPRTLGPRGGPFTFRHVVPTSPSGAPVTKQMVLEALLEQYRLTGYPGEFRLASTGNVLHVVPTRSKNATGESVAVRSLLDVNVSIPIGERTASNMLGAITRAVSRPGVAEVTPGTEPINLMAQVRVQDGATNESARAVLVRLLEATRQNLSWALLCEPGAVRRCALNVYPVKPFGGAR